MEKCIIKSGDEVDAIKISGIYKDEKTGEVVKKPIRQVLAEIRVGGKEVEIDLISKMALSLEKELAETGEKLAEASNAVTKLLVKETEFDDKFRLLIKNNDALARGNELLRKAEKENMHKLLLWTNAFESIDSMASNLPRGKELTKKRLLAIIQNISKFVADKDEEVPF